jgi:hypothetical protein
MWIEAVCSELLKAAPESAVFRETRAITGVAGIKGTF